MTARNSSLCLDDFYPNDNLKIIDVLEKKDFIQLKMKSISKSCKCHKCNSISEKYHGTYSRKVQDLPILGKSVLLDIRAHEYECTNSECDVTTISESFDGFLNTYSRMTERCADFICTLALETSCEGCARICKTLGIKTSGDTVIRLLLKRYELLPEPKVGAVIGIDDFAYKKRHTYGTVIVNEETHDPITLLDGRDGDSLRAWLKNNKNVKIITRDRASAYAKVISEELPDVMQVADRFHLHQNLLEAIKKALNSELPATVKIDKNDNVSESIAKDKTKKK